MDPSLDQGLLTEKNLMQDLSLTGDNLDEQPSNNFPPKPIVTKSRGNQN